MDFLIYENQMPYNKETRAAYIEENNRLRDLFEKDALRELGISWHHKARQAFEVAWEDCWPEGFSAVFDKLEKLAELMS